MEKQAEERGDRSGQPHILAVSLPYQGHVNPLLQFSKRLVFRGLHVTFVFPFVDYKFDLDLHAAGDQLPSGLKVHILTTPYHEPDPASRTIDGIFNYLQNAVSLRLAEFIRTQKGVCCVVYDSVMPWVLDVARDAGVKGASFFTQCNAVNAIYYCVHEGLLRAPLQVSSSPVISLEGLGLPPLKISDLPSFVSDQEHYATLLRRVVARFSNYKSADWVFANSFDTLEQQVVNEMASRWPIKNVGPTIPSVYLDNRFKTDCDYGLSLFKPQGETCRKWLDSKDTGSVVYVSLGSVSSMKEEQMEELAWGIRMSNSHFLWVVRQEELQKLPHNFIQDTADKGLVVTWCHQLEVLAHRAVGCFVTHCGWNSTLEALCLGVPMVALPQWTDQTTNAKLVKDVWGVGIRVKVDPKGFFTRDELEACIREVMEGENGSEMKNNSAKWKKLAVQAMDEGGSSDIIIQQFVEQLMLCN